MHRLICTFLVHIWQKTGFLMTWLKLHAHLAWYNFYPINKVLMQIWNALPDVYHIYIGGLPADISPLDSRTILFLFWEYQLCPNSLAAPRGKIKSLIRSKLPQDKTNKMTVRPAKTQISLGICLVWSESSLCAQWVARDPSFLDADSEDSDQNGRIPRLIWVFTGRACHLLVLSWGGSSLMNRNTNRQKKCGTCNS